MSLEDSRRPRDASTHPSFLFLSLSPCYCPHWGHVASSTAPPAARLKNPWPSLTKGRSSFAVWCPFTIMLQRCCEAGKLFGWGYVCVCVCVHTSKHVLNIQNIQLRTGSSVISVCLFNEWKITPCLIDTTLCLKWLEHIASEYCRIISSFQTTNKSM